MQKLIVILILILIPSLTYAEGEKALLRSLEKVKANIDQGVSLRDLYSLIADAKTELAMYKQQPQHDSLFADYGESVVGWFESISVQYDSYLTYKNIKVTTEEIYETRRELLKDVADIVESCKKHVKEKIEAMHKRCRQIGCN